MFMGSMQKVVDPPAPSTDAVAELRQRYGCGPVEFTGADNAPYGRSCTLITSSDPGLPLGTTWRLDLEDEIRLRILEKTWGRVQMAKIEAAGNRIVITGRAPSYYLKQLAIQAALDVLGARGRGEVEMDLKVRIKARQKRLKPCGSQ
jgi:hypothetical protein